MRFLKRKLGVTKLIMMIRVTDGLGNPGGQGGLVDLGHPGGLVDPSGQVVQVVYVV